MPIKKIVLLSFFFLLSFSLTNAAESMILVKTVGDAIIKVPNDYIPSSINTNEDSQAFGKSQSFKSPHSKEDLWISVTQWIPKEKDSFTPFDFKAGFVAKKYSDGFKGRFNTNIQWEPDEVKIINNYPVLILKGKLDSLSLRFSIWSHSTGSFSIGYAYQNSNPLAEQQIEQINASFQIPFSPLETNSSLLQPWLQNPSIQESIFSLPNLYRKSEKQIVTENSIDTESQLFSLMETSDSFYFPFTIEISHNYNRNVSPQEARSIYQYHSLTHPENIKRLITFGKGGLLYQMEPNNWRDESRVYQINGHWVLAMVGASSKYPDVPIYHVTCFWTHPKGFYQIRFLSTYPIDENNAFVEKVLNSFHFPDSDMEPKMNPTS